MIRPRQSRDRQKAFKRKFMDNHQGSSMVQLQPILSLRTTPIPGGPPIQASAHSVERVPQIATNITQGTLPDRSLQASMHQSSPQEPYNSPQMTNQSSPYPVTTSSSPVQANNASSQIVPTSVDLVNTANTCYSIVAVQALYSIRFQDYMIDDQSSVLATNLTNLLRQYLNGAVSDSAQLVVALNMNLSPRNQFTVGRQQCAGEFLSMLLSIVQSEQLLSLCQSVVSCVVCGFEGRCPYPASLTDTILLLSFPSTILELDLRILVNGALGQHDTNALNCEQIGCPLQGVWLPDRTVYTEKEVSIFWLGRNKLEDGQQIKVLAPVVEPSSH